MKDKTIFNSKKFAAYIVSLAVIAAVLIVALFKKTEFNMWTTAFMTIGILGICSLSIGYILGQASLDKFLRKSHNMAVKLFDNEDNVESKR